MRMGQGKGVKKQRLATSTRDSNRILSVFDATQHPAIGGAAGGRARPGDRHCGERQANAPGAAFNQTSSRISSPAGSISPVGRQPRRR